MEPLPPAVIATLTPKDVKVRFYDDRMEQIPFDEATDLVAISVETYTAKRAYQIATEFRKRGVPVIMGGFHASLCPDEVSKYAESVVIGEAEDLWEQVIEDYRTGKPKRFYKSETRPKLDGSIPDRSIFQGKKYLPVHLIEAGRGCPLHCEFCVIQTMFGQTQNSRPVEQILRELHAVKDRKKLVFFIDDNVISHPGRAKEFFRQLIPLKLRWVSQATINAAQDEELLALMAQSGCQGVLVGFESMEPKNLAQMGKQVNLRSQGGYEQALQNFARHRIRVYGTFVFGYDHDTPETFEKALDLSLRHGFFLTGFNHLTPFPGTELYSRLEREGRLLYDRWWMDDRYSYNMLPFKTLGMAPEDVQRHCVLTRKRFYSVPGILRRSIHPVNRFDPYMFMQFLSINFMHLVEVNVRNHYPLGDQSFQGPLLEVRDT